MKNILLVTIASLFLLGCKTEEKPRSWQLTQTIMLDGVNPIGIALTSEGIWLSDGDHNRVVLIDEVGGVIKSIDSLSRPMHISSNEAEVLIPLYGNDVVLRWKENIVKEIGVTDSLDAPAGVWREGTRTAIADFYNHRILYAENGIDWISFGKEGKAEGELYYPTDVQIVGNEIWVADAYNNRIQVFDTQGKFLKVIGADQEMNAATGLFVSATEAFITDFENNRVLVFDHKGGLKQVISEKIEKPTDMLLIDDQLYIINYGSSAINIYDWKETPEVVTSEEDHHEHDDH